MYIMRYKIFLYIPTKEKVNNRSTHLFEERSL